MPKTAVKLPFRADHVGSFLRPATLHESRKDYKAGRISADLLRAVETKEIKRIIEKQIDLGLEVVTDGEFRRTWFHLDFMEHIGGFEGYVPEDGYSFDGDTETEKYNVRNVGKIFFNPEHPHIKDFIELDNIVNGRAIVKQTIPSPNHFFNAGIHNEVIYPDIEEYADDIIKAYQDAIQTFYDAGVRYLQLDDVYIAGLAAPVIPFNDGKYDRAYLIELALRVANGALENKPHDLIITTHLCRGNYRSTHAFEGSYDPIAEKFLAKETVDGFFLEYDDDRSGDFKALAKIPQGGPRVVLGLVTTKTGELEDKADIIARIHEAAEYLPLDQLCLSPQCGFASTHHGNTLTEEEQWEKIKFVLDIAEEVWG